MNRFEFMKELEYLLQDISEEETADALDYYRDYLEEAGDENEADVLKEFGSPERIAAMIRSDLYGGMEDGGEFTDNGFQDSRFEDPRFKLANRTELPEVQDYEKSGPDNSGRSETRPGQESSPRMSKWVKAVLIVILICVAFPVALSVGGTAFGLLVAVIGVLFAVAVSIAAVTFALFAAAIAVLGAGFVNLFVQPLQGALLLGTGIALLGAALLCLILAIGFYGKLIPFLVRGFVDLVGRLFHRKGVA